MMAADQPRKYGSSQVAKSWALVTSLDLRKVLPEHRRQGLEIACFGNRSHYHPGTGICVHVESIYKAARSDWHRGRMWFLPFGDQEKDIKRVKGALI